MICHKICLTIKAISVLILAGQLCACQFFRKPKPLEPDMSKITPTRMDKDDFFHMEKKVKDVHL